ncbi:MAG: 3-hydroxyacyl-ACP dehydratase FabZ [Lentisphaerota bacterium]
MAIMETEEIMKVLPHRYPMLLVDRIIECDFKEKIVGIKNVTFNEYFFQGHFPGMPIMPGVLQLEALAQTAGILINKIIGKEGKIAFYLSVDKARFRRTILPGDQMRMEVVFLKVRLGMYKTHGKIFVDGQLACEADMMFGSKD